MQKVFNCKQLLNMRMNKMISYDTTHRSHLKTGQSKAAVTGRWGFHGRPHRLGCQGQICSHLGLGGLGKASLSLSFPVCTTKLPVPGPRSCFGDGRKSCVDESVCILSSHQSGRSLAGPPLVLRVRRMVPGGSPCLCSLNCPAGHVT